MRVRVAVCLVVLCCPGGVRADIDSIKRSMDQELDRLSRAYGRALDDPAGVLGQSGLLARLYTGAADNPSLQGSLTASRMLTPAGALQSLVLGRHTESSGEGEAFANVRLDRGGFIRRLLGYQRLTYRSGTQKTRSTNKIETTLFEHAATTWRIPGLFALTTIRDLLDSAYIEDNRLANARSAGANGQAMHTPIVQSSSGYRFVERRVRLLGVNLFRSDASLRAQSARQTKRFEFATK